MATHTFTIPLTDGTTSVASFYSGDRNDTTYTTYTTLIDGGNLSNVKLTNFGLGTATENSDDDDDDGGQSAGGDDELYMDLSGFDDDFSLELQSVDAGDTIYVSGAIVTGANAYTYVDDVYTINYMGSDGFQHTLVVDLESTNGSGVANIVITWFAKGTMIETDQGPMAVQDLGLGIQVKCGDGRFRPIQWTAKRHINAPELNLHPEFRPIRISQNSLGQNRPQQDLLVSPQHRILIDDWRAELLFASDEVLVPAKHLVNDLSIAIDRDAIDVTYYHFMLDSHQTVISNGLETESFHPGEMALSGIADEARTELFALFPQLENKPESFGPTYRPALKAYEAATLFAPK